MACPRRHGSRHLLLPLCSELGDRTCLRCVVQMMPAYGSPGYGTPMYPHSAMYGVSYTFSNISTALSCHLEESSVAVRKPARCLMAMHASLRLSLPHHLLSHVHAGCATVHGIHHASSSHPGERQEMTALSEPRWFILDASIHTQHFPWSLPISAAADAGALRSRLRRAVWSVRAAVGLLALAERHNGSGWGCLQGRG